MKSYNIRYLLSGLFTLFIFNSNAQTSEDRNITVERDYQPVIQDAGKISSLPEVLTTTVTKERVDYADFGQVLPLGKNIILLPAVEVLHQRSEISDDALVQLAFGNYWNSFGRLALPLIKNDKTRLDFNLGHTGTFGKRKHALTDGNIRFNQFFPKLEFYAGVGLQHEFFNYYGDEFSGGATPKLIDLNNFAMSNPGGLVSPAYKEIELEEIARKATTTSLSDFVARPETDVLWRSQIFTGLKTLPDASGLQQYIEMKYDRFNSRNSLQEHIINTRYGFNNGMMKNRFGMDFQLTNLFYRQNDLPALNFWDYYAVFTMNPYYSIQKDSWYLRAGVKAAFSFVHGKPFNPMPDIKAEWKILPDYLAVYGGVTGEYEIMSLNTMYKENPWVYSDLRLKDQYTPVNAYLGIKVKAAHNLLIDAFVDYRFINDQYFYINKEYQTTALTGDSATLFTNRFNAIYSDAGLFRTGIRAGYHIRGLVNLQFKAVYNGWDVKSERYAWLKPAVESDLSAEVKVNKKITASMHVFYQGERYARMGKTTAGDVRVMRLKPITDINLGATYTFTKNIAAFARINNLFNQQYEHFNGYEVQGLNLLIGGSLSF